MDSPASSIPAYGSFDAAAGQRSILRHLGSFCEFRTGCQLINQNHRNGHKEATEHKSCNPSPPRKETPLVPWRNQQGFEK